MGFLLAYLRWLDTVFQLPEYQFLTLKNSPKTWFSRNIKVTCKVAIDSRLLCCRVFEDRSVPSNVTLPWPIFVILCLQRVTNSLKRSVEGMNTAHYGQHFGQVWLISVRAFSNKARLFFQGSVFGFFRTLKSILENNDSTKCLQFFPHYISKEAA